MKDLYSEDLNRVCAFMDEMNQEDQNNKSSLIQIWRRNIAFANGNQFLSFGNSLATPGGNGTELLLSPNQNNQQQMYISDEIDPVMRTLVSYMTRAQPNAEAFSVDKSSESKRRAKLVERILEAKYVLDNEYKNSRMAAYLAFCTGTVFRKDFWDTSSGHKVQLPVYDPQGNEIYDENGNVQMSDRYTGDNSVAILNPLSISFDWTFTDFERLPWIQESYLMFTDWVKEAYDQTAPGYTGKAKDVTEGDSVGLSIEALEEMKYDTPFNLGVSNKIKRRGRTLVQELCVQPNRDMPHGRYMIRAGGGIVFDSYNKGKDLGSPYYMPEPDSMWHPYSMFIYEPYIGRMLGKSMVEGITSEQMRINEINGAILKNANTIAKPDILAAENQLKKGIFNGDGSNVYTYKIIPGAGPPIRWEGAALPTQFFKEKEDLIQQIARKVGTNFVMQGTPPTGVSAASAIEQLLENANSQQSDLMNSWQIFHQQGYTKKIRIIRKYCKIPNEKIISYLRTISKDALQEDITSFVGEDIGDGITVKIEASSMIPKSEKFKKDTLKDLAMNGMLGPIQEESPRGVRLRKELLTRFGEDKFESEENTDVEKATWENDRIKKMQPPDLYEYDNHAIHLSIHTTMRKDPKFLERANPEIVQFLDAHIAETVQAMQPPMPDPAQMAAMAGQGIPPQGMPEGIPGIPQGMPNLGAQAPMMQ